MKVRALSRAFAGQAGRLPRRLRIQCTGKDQDKAREWHGVDKSFMMQIHGAFKSRWDDRFVKTAKTNKPLIELCNKRVERLRG
jgi:hypothetical protein